MAGADLLLADFPVGLVVHRHLYAARQGPLKDTTATVAHQPGHSLHREGLGRPGIQVVTPSAVTKLHDQALLDALQCCSIATIPAAGAWGWITSHLSRLNEHSRYPDGATTLNVLLKAGDFSRRYADAPTGAVISPTCAWGRSLD